MWLAARRELVQGVERKSVHEDTARLDTASDWIRLDVDGHQQLVLRDRPTLRSVAIVFFVCNICNKLN